MNKKILIFDHDERFSGSTKSLVFILDELKKNGFQIIIYTNKNREIFSHLSAFSDQIISFNKIFTLNISNSNDYSFFSVIGIYACLLIIKRFFTGIFFAIKIIILHKPDIIFINEYVLLQFAIAGYFTKTPSITYVRGQYRKGKSGLLGKLIRFLLLKFNDIVFVISKNEASQLINPRTKYYGKKIVLVREFLNDLMNNSKKNNNTIFTEYNIPKNKNIVLFVGGFSRIKGTKVFLKAVENISKIRNDILFILVGNQNTIGKDNIQYANDCFDYIKVKELSNNLLIIDELSDISELIQICDIMLSCNTTSHFSRPIIEAWNEKKPVIVSDFPHIREYVDEGINGLFYQHNNVTELVLAIQTLIDDNKLKTALGENGFQKANNLFDSKINCKIVIDNCNKLINIKSA